MKSLKLLKISILFALIILTTLTPNIANSQEQSKPKAATQQYSYEDIWNQKIAFFTQELQLTSKEAEKFWPVYNEYWKTMDNARFQTMKSLKALNAALKIDEEKTDAEINTLTEDYLNKRKAEDGITSQFYIDVKKVIPIKKAAKVFQAEENFRVMLIRQLRHKKTN